MKAGTDINHDVPPISQSEDVKHSILRNLKYSLARDPGTATLRDWWYSLSKAAQERIIERMIATQGAHAKEKPRRLYYLSLEYLMGRLLGNNLLNIGIFEQSEHALNELGLELEEIRDQEYDMALGNGGLGRLAACFLDSLATLDFPAIGYGIHYEFGLFKQEFVNGYQVERPDEWLRYGDAWELVRPEYTQKIQIGGRVENVFDDLGNYTARWVDFQTIVGVPYDIPICGYGGKTVNFLRLWESHAQEEFDFKAFNAGGYSEALQRKNLGETITKVLYPNDQTENGKELRLLQQYFFVTCSLRDILRRFERENGPDWKRLSDKVKIQLNDTHPAVAIAELMRILHDEHRISWEEAWGLTTQTFAYTNHTIMPEALERWSVPLFSKVLPRHLQIIFEINGRFLKEVEAKWPGDLQKKRDLSLVEEGPVQMLRMAHLAVVGSFSINGVAELHTRLIREKLFKDFNTLYPARINNKTNGITPRRWLLSVNRELSELIDEKVGKGWVTDLDKLRGLESFAGDEGVLGRILEIKRGNKQRLVETIRQDCGVEVSPDALFDVQVKRLHEYKRQHLNLLHILTLYRRLLQNPDYDMHPRVFVFGAKAAPGYVVAKCIIKAINSVAEKINNDPHINGKLKVVFLPNYRVSLASMIMPAADLSEQISTAGMEASGTGNMKLGLNGAVTIGTLDGANIEILEEVGAENIFIFGMTVQEVEALRARGYKPQDIYKRDEELKAVMDWLGSRHFIPNDPHDTLAPLLHSLLEGGDPFMVLADYHAYCDAQQKADRAYKDRMGWARMSLLNTARLGKFSSDRTIREYAHDIWNLQPVVVP
ncbi:MAG: glycogen/starch/alpha-glucan phosphorylase [Methylacidiphilales bacterium]|nr:glycogen/starch/alpha-glucan phosphorylase [Candidatus Methylacidiphilales bacterium]